MELVLALEYVLVPGLPHSPRVVKVVTRRLMRMSVDVEVEIRMVMQMRRGMSIQLIMIRLIN